MFTICVVNRKGGVGKTTIASNLAQCLALLGKKVLVVDNDEQHNISAALGIRKLPAVTLAHLYDNASMLSEAVVTSFIDGLDCICGSDKLASAKPKKTMLKEILSDSLLTEVGYDFCIIDNGPSLDEKVITAVNASDAFLLPLTLKMFAFQGLREMVERLERLGVDKQKIIILRNEMKKNVAYEATSQAVEQVYNDILLRTIIPYDETFEKVLADEKCIVLSKSKSKAASAIIELVIELLGLDVDSTMNTLEQKRLSYKKDNALKNLGKYRLQKQSQKIIDVEKVA